jgi:tRNA(Ile)-lysidine synthase
MMHPPAPTKLLPLEFRVSRRLGESLRGSRVLVACSGGRDSVALAVCLASVAQRYDFTLALAYVHHGLTADPRVSVYRDAASRRVRSLGKALGLKVFVSRPRSGVQHPVSQAEEELRNFRLARLAALVSRKAFDCVAFAHHADDLLETRLIRLIRGTGPSGLRAMSENGSSRLFGCRILRPFLSESQREIAAYVEAKGLDWSEDPTNSDSGPLRNWIRNEWLADLNQKRPGSSVAIARSLGLIVEALDGFEAIRPAAQSGPGEQAPLSRASVSRASVSPASLARAIYERSEKTKRLNALLEYVRTLGVRNWTRASLIEVDKRISSLGQRKRIEFQVLGLRWSVDPETIRATIDMPDVEETPQRVGRSSRRNRRLD